VDPVKVRLAALETESRTLGQDDDADAAALVAGFVATVRDVLPRADGRGPVRALLAAAVDRCRDLLARYRRIPASYAGQPVGPGGGSSREALRRGLVVLVRYVESVDHGLAADDAAQLLALADRIDTVFGAGWEPPRDAEEASGGPSWAALLRDLLAGAARAVPGEAVAFVLLFAAALLAALIKGSA